ncbi:hypothetical protein ABW02_23500 [Niallia circulans]|jgi:hypothetical protein|uniref:Lon proteolytic domain-containing protein n=3 Tax=Niallia TaxID=2837506 RepID=A0A0J1I2A6_NIACI|nr:S16 family serine protease [Niallia circulans]AYV68720.1 hypothetical protein C2I06_18570 [Niallia circulans]KLV20086.1 hypothetical protein ABW02_23500 [Niallia circulans]PAD81345.1 hypothetical protein CHH57_20520 [Niallia circulans]QJX64624.1 hypothetical protein HLK66_25210 [Niallia circulans]
MSSINNKIAKLSPKKLKVRNRLKNKSIKDYEFPPVSRLILLYLTSLIFYFFNIISGFIFVTALLFLFIFLIIHYSNLRKKSNSNRVFVMPFLLPFLIVLYEFPIIFFDEYKFLVTSFNQPEEIISGTNIYFLSVKEDTVSNIQNEKEVRNIYATNHQEIYEIVPVTNFIRYTSKNQFIYELVGLKNPEFEQYYQDISAYIGSDNTLIKEFLSRKNSQGNSAGLALVLSSYLIEQNFQNDILIGVTGSVNKSGKVEEVGYIKEKILSAERSGLTFIIVPNKNIIEANEIKDDLNLSINIIGVSKIDEAIQLIEDLHNGKN